MPHIRAERQTADRLTELTARNSRRQNGRYPSCSARLPERRVERRRRYEPIEIGRATNCQHCADDMRAELGESRYSIARLPGLRQIRSTPAPSTVNVSLWPVDSAPCRSSLRNRQPSPVSVRTDTAPLRLIHSRCGLVEIRHADTRRHADLQNCAGPSATSSVKIICMPSLASRTAKRRAPKSATRLPYRRRIWNPRVLASVQIRLEHRADRSRSLRRIATPQQPRRTDRAGCAPSAPGTGRRASTRSASACRAAKSGTAHADTSTPQTLPPVAAQPFRPPRKRVDPPAPLPGRHQRPLCYRFVHRFRNVGRIGASVVRFADRIIRHAEFNSAPMPPQAPRNRPRSCLRTSSKDNRS